MAKGEWPRSDQGGVVKEERPRRGGQGGVAKRCGEGVVKKERPRRGGQGGVVKGEWHYISN